MYKLLVPSDRHFALWLSDDNAATLLLGSSTYKANIDTIIPLKATVLRAHMFPGVLDQGKCPLDFGIPDSISWHAKSYMTLHDTTVLKRSRGLRALWQVYSLIERGLHVVKNDLHSKVT